MPQTHELEVECEACGGFGFLSTQAADVGIYCVRCKGKGFQTIAYQPFTGRKKRRGIRIIRRSGTGVIPGGRRQVGIPYAAFLKGRMP